MRGAYVVNSLVSFDIDPAAVGNTATRKSDKACRSAIDNRELQITAKWCGIYRFPFHVGRYRPAKQPRSVIEITSLAIVWLTTIPARSRAIPT